MNSLPSLVPVVEELVNRHLSRDPEACEELERLQDKMVSLEAWGIEWSIVICIAADGIHFSAGPETPPDAGIAAAPITLLRLSAAKDLSPWLTSDDIAISGDEELVRRLHALLRRVDVDWEQRLAVYIGQPLARWLGEIGQNVRSWGRYQGELAADEPRKLLEEELHLVPGRNEVDAFGVATKTLSEKVDRLEQRIRQLAALSGNNSR